MFRCGVWALVLNVLRSPTRDRPPARAVPHVAVNWSGCELESMTTRAAKGRPATGGRALRSKLTVMVMGGTLRP